MTLLQTLKSFINRRLAVAAEEILGEVERVVKEYAEESVYLKQQIEQKDKRLQLLLQPVIKLHRAGWYIHYSNFRARWNHSYLSSCFHSSGGTETAMKTTFT